MLYFTLSGSSDITGYQFLLVYFFVYMESDGRFKFESKFGSKIEFELEGFFEVFLKKCLGSPCYLIVVSGGSFLLMLIFTSENK